MRISSYKKDLIWEHKDKSTSPFEKTLFFQENISGQSGNPHQSNDIGTDLRILALFFMAIIKKS
jgi:hypothetical protein